MKKELVWNVYSEMGFRNDKIEIFNIFEHNGFLESLYKDKVVYKKNIKNGMKEDDAKAEFFEAVRKDLLYYYWCKCEWEIGLTSWPAYIEKGELDRLNKEDIKYRDMVNLSCYKKVDVYSQVMMNSEVFFDYVFSNMKYIRSVKKK